MNKIKVHDTVKITTGRFKGHQGVVTRRLGESFHVEGVTVTKAVRPNPSIDEKGGLKQVPAKIHASNLALMLNNKIAKVGIKTIDGRRYRFDKVSGEMIDQVKA